MLYGGWRLVLLSAGAEDHVRQVRSATELQLRGHGPVGGDAEERPKGAHTLQHRVSVRDRVTPCHHHSELRQCTHTRIGHGRDCITPLPSARPEVDNASEIVSNSYTVLRAEFGRFSCSPYSTRPTICPIRAVQARPTINQILTTPIVKRYVQQLLSSTLEQRDFGASIARLARPTPAAPAPAPAPAAARGSPRIPRQAADQGSVGSRSRAGSGSRASELEIRRRHQMMAVQREKDRRRVEQAKAQMALDQARAAARENKEKEIAKLERQKWLEREKKRDKELSEQAEEKQQEAARLRAVKLAQREQYVISSNVL